MTRRIIFATIAIGLVLTGFFVPGFGWMMLMISTAIAIGCLGELHRMLALKSGHFSLPLMVLALLVLSADAVLNNFGATLPLLGSFLVLAWMLRLRGNIDGAVTDMGASALALLYVVVPFVVFAGLFQVGIEAREWILLSFAIIWMTDTGALFIGRAIGKTKMAPKISPKKTVAGLFGGLAAAGLTVLVVRVAFNGPFEGVSDLHFVLFALGISLLGQFGDLSESLLKRDIGVKDSGGNWSGHGGFLDRMDSIIFTIVPLYLYLSYFQPAVLAGSSTPL